MIQRELEMKQQTKLEYISPSNQAYSMGDTTTPKKRSSRAKLFIITFLVSLLIGLIINYSRPAVYQSSATLLTSAATAVDQGSGEVDFQNVAIQKQKLLGAELLTETVGRVKLLENSPDFTDLTLIDVRNMLTVEPIEETNLLAMLAEGPNPEVLPVVINTWIDVYLQARALSVKNAANDTVSRVNNELIELEAKIEKTRQELDLFRKQHDISSIVREENELPATLISLTKAFNLANEEVVQTKAKLDAINQAIAQGQAVVPKQEQTSLSEMEKEYRELTAKLAEFDKNFTREYLQYQGSMKYIPEQIKKLEKQIKQKKEAGKGMVWTEASQNYYAAKQVAEKVRQQLDEHKAKAANFTTLFSKHQKLIDDLESMELLTRETQDRLVKIESKQFEKYPQVDVIERASVNRQAVRPDYTMGLLIVFAVALFLAFFAIWFRDFLMQDPLSEPEEQGLFDFPIAAWLGRVPANEVIAQQESRQVIEQSNQNGLPQIPGYQKLTEADIRGMLVHGDKNTQQLILLLLSGLSLDEISNLTLDQVNSDLDFIQLSGKYTRDLPVGKVLQGKLKDSLRDAVLWGEQETLSVEEMEAMLLCSAVDIGLDGFNDGLADALRQAYIIYLVEQGLRLNALPKIVGYQSPLELASYANFSPAGEGLNIEQVQLIYPLCNYL